MQVGSCVRTEVLPGTACGLRRKSLSKHRCDATVWGEGAHWGGTQGLRSTAPGSSHVLHQQLQGNSWNSCPAWLVKLGVLAGKIYCLSLLAIVC